MTPNASDDEASAALAEIEQLLSIPLSELVSTEEERARAQELAAQAAVSPAMTRLAEVVAFIGQGQPATQAGNLKATDARALARRLGLDEEVADARNLNDLPDTAAFFRWAGASGLLTWRGTKIVAGPLAPDLERDPLSAWLRVAITLLEHGLLDGFRQGWRKSYVEALEQSAPELLTALIQVDSVSLESIEEESWRLVADTYGYEPDNAAERRHVARMVRGMISRMFQLGMVDVSGDDVALTALGELVAAAVMFASDDPYDPDDLDLVDTDAASLLLVCNEEMEPGESSNHLLAWCQARPADEAADELCEAMLDDDEPDVWALGFEALTMLDRAVAEPAVRRLRSNPDLRPLAAAWLRRLPPGSGGKAKGREQRRADRSWC